MLKADFFARFGMLVVENFLDQDACRMLRREVRRSIAAPAAVVRKGEKLVDEGARRTTRAQVTKRTESCVRSKLLALRSRLESHFGVKLRGIQQPQFLIYRPGDFFECHSDNDLGRHAPRYLRERRISAVLFLNGSARGRERGGGLTFPGLIDHARLRARSFQVQAQTGTLIAFRSDAAHAVAPVTGRDRYTVVTWFV
jgi:SM-20-related protein